MIMPVIVLMLTNASVSAKYMEMYSSKVVALIVHHELINLEPALRSLLQFHLACSVLVCLVALFTNF